MEQRDDFLPFIKDEKIKMEQKNLRTVLLTNIVPPWVCLHSNTNTPPLIRFHNEILDFCDFLAPNNSEMNSRNKVLQEMKCIINSIWPLASVHVFGSQLTEIITPSSDLDIAILDVPEEEGKNHVDLLNKLADRIKQLKIISYVEVISSAKVPIIKFDHLQTKISVDICINNASGLETGKLIQDYVRDFPALRPLTMVLKVFLSQRRLNDTYSGGIGSFVLVCMIVSCLQMRSQLERLRGLSITCNLAALLVDFFALYGGSFNYMHTGISLANGGRYYRKRERGPDWFNPGRPGLLSIENPAVPDVDMGRNSFLMPRIRKAFEHAHQALLAGLQSGGPSVLGLVVRGDDTSWATREHKTQHPAAATVTDRKRGRVPSPTRKIVKL